MAVKERVFYDISTACRLSNYSQRHFRRLLHNGTIPLVMIGRKHYVLKMDLDTFLERKANEDYNLNNSTNIRKR